MFRVVKVTKQRTILKMLGHRDAWDLFKAKLDVEVVVGLGIQVASGLTRIAIWKRRRSKPRARDMMLSLHACALQSDKW